MSEARRPVSTYRLQFSRRFRFPDAQPLVPYFHDLGITDCYSSPVLKATPGSTHGYDIGDHTRLNPELGSEAEFAAWCAALKGAGLGHLVDFVPNHMSCDPTANPWWRDVLENGPSSPYARYFDIDWDAGQDRAEAEGAAAAARRSVWPRCSSAASCSCASRDGALHLRYFERDLPINPTAGAAGARREHRAARGQARRRSGAPRISEHPDRAAEPAGLHRAGCRRASSSASGKRKSRASVWCVWSRESPAISEHIDAAVDAGQRPARRSRQLRPAARAARAPGLPARLLADRGRRDQLPPVLRHQRAGRAADGRAGGVRGDAPAAPPADRVGPDHRAAHRSPGRARSIRRTTSRACSRWRRRPIRAGVRVAVLHRRREDPLGGRVAARPTGRSRARPATAFSTWSPGCSSTAGRPAGCAASTRG